MTGVLKIIATPIGNAQDISLRAMRELEQADVILAEDTRHSKNLINYLGIKLKPECLWLSCSAQIEKQRSQTVISYLQKNYHVALMTDAGCPGISDPGSLLVRDIISAGYEIQVIPGPSALTASIMGSGIDTTRFAFLGFLPMKKTARQNIILSAANAGLALVIYESPVRVLDLLAELFEYLGERRVVVARELTKTFETFHRGMLGQVLNPEFVEKGECVVIVESGELVEKISHKASLDHIEEYIKLNLANNITPKNLAQLVAVKFNIRKKQAYDLILKILM